MNSIHITASKSYDVLVGRGLLKDVGTLISPVLPKAKTLAVISDSNVFPLYGKTVEEGLKAAGFEVVSFVFPAGEASKNLETYGKILNFLIENHISRSDAIIALGGGVTGDMGGFAAATYRRGIKYIQVPTTLLASVDSSVGGKTAVDLPGGKNMVGAFYQPSMVICDPDVFETLPESIFADGCAEVIKYGMLGNAEFFGELRALHAKEQIEHVISVCVEMKRDIVAEDEFDTGKRRLLNLGHTFGHSVEACSNFKISHGSAVAIGMQIITRAAVEMGLCEAEALPKLLEILEMYKLPMYTDMKLEELYNASLSDKKTEGKKINLVVPTKIGCCDVMGMPQEDMRKWLKAGGINE